MEIPEQEMELIAEAKAALLKIPYDLMISKKGKYLDIMLFTEGVENNESGILLFTEGSENDTGKN